MRRLLFSILCVALLATGIWALARRTPSTSTSGAAVPAEPPWFEDVTRALGLDFVHDCGPLGNYPMPQQVGMLCRL
jgi:hypothetical protein